MFPNYSGHENDFRGWSCMQAKKFGQLFRYSENSFGGGLKPFCSNVLSMMGKGKIEKGSNDGAKRITIWQGRREKLSPRQAIECNRSLMLSALSTRCIAAKPKATLTWSSRSSVTRKLSSIDQTSKRSLRLSAIRKSLKKLVFRQKPPKIPTIEEFDASTNIPGSLIALSSLMFLLRS